MSSFEELSTQDVVINKKALLGSRITHCYREEPVTTNDSGWRFISEGDGENALNNGEGVIKSTLQRVSVVLPDIKHHMDSPPGTVFAVTSDKKLQPYS